HPQAKPSSPGRSELRPESEGCSPSCASSASDHRALANDAAAARWSRTQVHRDVHRRRQKDGEPIGALAEPLPIDGTSASSRRLTRVERKRTGGYWVSRRLLADCSSPSQIPLPVSTLVASTASSILSPPVPTSYDPPTRSKWPRIVRPRAVPQRSRPRQPTSASSPKRGQA